MDQGSVRVAREGAVAVVTLARPERFNAFDPAMAAELHGAVRALASQADVGAVVLTGEGRAFCAGGDARAMRAGERDPAAVFRALTKEFHPTIHLLATMPKTTLAAVNGPAAGGGFPLALACDLRIASPAARFKAAYLTLGVVPDGGSTWLLPRIVGDARARELLLTDAALTAEQALAWGIVGEVVEASRLLPRALELATRAAAAPRFALAKTKELLAQSSLTPFREQLAAERRWNARSAAEADFLEGLRAFEEKRPPRFPSASQG